jgi:hypothetical protein
MVWGQLASARYSGRVFLCTFAESVTQPPDLVGEEAQMLGRLEPSVPIGTGFVLTAQSEEQFYLTNNLPEQLRQIFAGINPRRLDEDALEDACKRAQKLVTESFLLEDFISQAYLALKNLKLEQTVLHVRRPFSRVLEVGEGRRGALLALKRLWTRDWDFERALERLDLTGSVGLEARAAYLFAGSGGAEDANASGLASKALGRTVRAVSSTGKIVGIE